MNDKKVDVMFLAWNRREFTVESFTALARNTDWDLVHEFVVIDDGSSDGTFEFLKSVISAIPCKHRLLQTRFGGACAATLHCLDQTTAPILAKLDNDAMYPPGWLRESLAVMDRCPELDMLGLEAFYGVENTSPFRSYIRTNFISGLGLYRRSTFERFGRPSSKDAYTDLETWMIESPAMVCGWIRPSLSVFLLDRIPFDPYLSLSNRYEAQKWQRPWKKDPIDSKLWGWWKSWKSSILATPTSETTDERSTFKINVGSGGRPMPGFVNVDFHKHPGVDVVAPAWALGFPDGSASELQCHHVIEHFFPKDWPPTLNEFWRVLAPGGKIILSCPDFGEIAAGYTSGKYTIDNVRETVLATVPPFNSCDYNVPESYHRTAHSEASLLADLTTKGFVDLKTWREGPYAWNLFVSGMKPAPAPATKTLCLVVIAETADDLRRFVAPLDEVDELVLVTNPGARFGGTAAIANRVLEATVCDVFGLVQADTSFEPGALRALAQATNGKVSGLVGKDLSGAEVWSKNLQNEAAVSTLDSCSVFFDRRDLDLEFDEETFDSFHCVVEDLCLSAASKGLSIVVPPAQANHVGKNWKENHDKWMAEYWVYRKKLDAKWPGVEFKTT